MMILQTTNLKMRRAAARGLGLSAALTLAMLATFPSGACAQHAAAGQPLAKQAVAQAPAAAPAVASVATPPLAKPASEGEETATAAKPGTEGIKIHGHWVIDLKNPDGTVVEHRDFQNSLVAGSGLATMSGDQVLAALLSGNAVPGGLGVAFISGNTTGLDASSFCNNGITSEAPVPNGIQCFGLVASASALSDTQSQLNSNSAGGPTFGQPGLTALFSFSPAVSIVLSGNFTVLPAYNLSSVTAVQTYLGLCFPGSASNFATTGVRLTGVSSNAQQADIAPNACVNHGGGIGGPVNSQVLFGALTSTNVPGGPLAVTAGQVISVTVTISFS